MSMTNQQASKPGWPISTWVLMAAALAITLLLVVSGSLGITLPPWLFAAPAVLGLAGSFLAGRNDKPGWMVVSGAWGLALIPGMIMIVTLIGGP